MLEYLKLREVGPAASIDAELAPRLNIFTGDNGLGKSFLLDIAWWALSRTWSSMPARPIPGARAPSIALRIDGTPDDNGYTSTFDRRAEAWTGGGGRPRNPGLVLYARADGGFSLWDPARNYWRGKGTVDVQERPRAYLFEPEEVWNGLVVEDKIMCNGLIRDWSLWQKEKGEAFEELLAVLARLSPSTEEKLVPGQLTRVSLDDVRDIPTLVMPYGHEVPVLHASAGIRRIIALGYLLVWAWQEHKRASRLLEEEATQEVLFLIDEIEAHLHPHWQRVILRSILDVANVLLGIDGTRVQLLCVTHSPLTLASLEPWFDESSDRLFHLGLREKKVILEPVPWSKQGDTTSWLVSEVFGLRQARSIEAERAIEAAEAFMRGARSELPPDLETKDSIHAELMKVLPGHDPFWPRWIVHVEGAEE